MAINSAACKGRESERRKSASDDILTASNNDQQRKRAGEERTAQVHAIDEFSTAGEGPRCEGEAESSPRQRDVPFQPQLLQRLEQRLDLCRPNTRPACIRSRQYKALQEERRQNEREGQRESKQSSNLIRATSRALGCEVEATEGAK